MAGKTSSGPGAYDSRNPGYAGQSSDIPQYGMPDSAYAAPDINRDAPYTDAFGWSASTRIQVNGTPDAMRENLYPVRDVRPTPNEAPGVWYSPIDADDRQRHSVEEIDANGWDENKGTPYRVGRNARDTPPPETRLTERMSPRRYSFLRPWDQGSKGNGARTLNGNHFSMADHRREYEVLGMRPWSQHRNTYRVDPAPWDADMYDVPPESTIGAVTQGRIQAVEVPESSSNRSFRL